MIHKMNLHPAPFASIRSGTKTIEMRLLDEKRQKIQAGDEIEFTSRGTSEVLRTKVVALHKFESFDELYRHFPKQALGYRDEEVAHPNDMTQFYPAEEIKEFGVVGIEIRLI